VEDDVLREKKQERRTSISSESTFFELEDKRLTSKSIFPTTSSGRRPSSLRLSMVGTRSMVWKSCEEDEMKSERVDFGPSARLVPKRTKNGGYLP